MTGVRTAVFLAFFVWAVSGSTLTLTKVRETRQLLRSPCPEGSFRKKHDQTCMECDENCEVGCVKYDGCKKCKAGFFTSREDNSWPYTCRKCDIEHCVKCRDEIYNAWPVQCTECAEGYVRGQDGKSCDPVATVGGVEEVKGVAVEVAGAATTKDGAVSVTIQGGASVQSEGTPSTPEEEDTPPEEGTPSTPEEEATPPEEGTPACGEGQFVKSKDNSCMDCDANCAEGNCVDGHGCNGCKPGYFRSAADPFWPWECKECTIENCDVCEDAVFDAWPKFCTKCAEGYELQDRTTCVPVTTPEPEPVPVEEVPEVSGSGVPEETEETTTCGEGQFVKSKDNTCMDCDANCAEGNCVDGHGCNGCKPGYFRSAADPFWPWECKECTIENCDVCEDAVFDAWPKFCTKCAEGYELQDRTTCVPITTPEPEPVPVEEQKVEKPSKPSPEVGGEEVCPEGYFRESKKQTCMKCDDNCATCVDGKGCVTCKPGTNTFRTRHDPFWPYVCVPCPIKDCMQCVDGVYDTQKPRCAVCGNGTSRYNGGTECA